MADWPKGEFEESLSMRAQADEVFNFVADVQNMPKYLPTTRNAQAQDGDHVRVQGEAKGHRYDSDGYLRSDPSARRLEWGADEGYYAGWMQVREDGNGSAVTVHISMKGEPPGADQRGAPAPEHVTEGIRKGLQSIRNHVEGHGGNEEPRTAH